MKNQSLKNAIPVILRYLADELGVQVVWGAAHAHTWDNVIYLPNLKEEEGVAKLALGFGSHEAAHVKKSTQSVYEEASKEAPFVVKLMNVMEDVRIEGLMMKEHPSIRPWLSHTAEHVLGGAQNWDGLSEAATLHNAILYLGRARHLMQPLAAEADGALKVMKEKFGPGRTTKVMALVGQIPACENTQAVYELTHQILDVLDEEEPEDQEQEQDQSQGDQGDQGGQGDQGDQGDQGNQGGEGDQGNQGDQGGQSNQGNESDQGGQSNQGNESDQGGKGNQGGQSGDNGNGEQSPQGGGSDGASSAGSASGGDGSQGAQSLKQKVLAASAGELDDLKSDLGEAVAKILAQKTDTTATTPASVLQTPIGNEGLCKDTAMNGRAASMGMRQVLLGLIQGSQNARPVLKRTGRSIDASRLARVAVGETRVFRKTEPVQRVNAAFQILLDASSSMSAGVGPNGKSAIRMAEESVVAVLHSLEGMQGVTSGAMVFPRSGVSKSRVSVGVLKRHNQTLNRALAENRFGVIASGGTPLAEAIWPAAGDLLAAKGERKVLAVITDGEPADSTSAAEMIARCRASGIEVFAIAFGSVNQQELTKVFGSSWTYLSDVSQLRAGLSKLVQQVLTKSAA